MAQQSQNNKDKDRDGKKKPVQDDTLLIVAVALILIVMQTYVFSTMQKLSVPQKIVIRIDSDDVARAINQDLNAQRNNIETHLKNFLYVPDNNRENPVLINRRDFFSTDAWGHYQSYIAAIQKYLADQKSVRAEFIFGTPRYAVLVDGGTAFRADGLFCMGTAAAYQCGPQGFRLEVLMRGDIRDADQLRFDSWRLLPARNADAAAAASGAGAGAAASAP